MQVALVRDRGQHVEVGARDPRQPEQRHPHREVEQPRVVSDALACRREPLGRARGTDPGAQAPPQLGLPGLWDSVRPAGPRPDHVRTVHPVAIEQVGDVADRAEPAHRVLRVAACALEVARERGQPRLAQALVDDLEQWPHRAFRHPGVVFRIDPARRRQRSLDETPGKRELDVRAHAVLAVAGGSEARREALGQPALDPARRNGHDVGFEGVLERREQRFGQPVGETVRALGSVDMQHCL